MTPAVRQKPRAMRVASRTVWTSAGDPEPVVKDVISDAGSAMAQTPEPAPPRAGRTHPAVEPHHASVAGVGASIQPTGEQHADRDGDIDHVAALQALMAVERDRVEQVLERGVGAERQQEADQPDDVPGDAFPARQSRGPAGMPQREEGDDGKDAQVDLDLGQVVVREERGLPEMAVPAEEVRHERQQAVGRREAPRGGKCAAQPRTLGIGDGGNPGQPLHGGQRKGQARRPPRSG